MNSVNYISFGKTKPLLLKKDSDDHTKAMIDGLKKLELTINEERDLHDTYIADGRKEKAKDVYERLMHLNETRNFLVKKIQEAKEKNVYPKNISEDITKQQPSTHNNASL